MKLITKISIKDYDNINEMIKPANYQLDANNPFITGYKIEIDRQIVGFICYSKIYDRIELEYIYIIPQYRNQHLASELIEKMLEEPNANITLEVNEVNSAAINLYKKYRFVEIAKRKQYYQGHDAIVMERKN